MYDISGKMAPLARDMAAGFDLGHIKSQISEYLRRSAGYRSQSCSVCVQVKIEVLAKTSDELRSTNATIE